MGYLITATKGQLEDGTAYSLYRNYLNSIKGDLPKHIYEFAAASWHYDFNDPRCLHDAWLERLLVTENAEGMRSEVRDVSVELRLLGAYHDRIITLCYEGVSSYEIKSPSAPNGHGDLMIDEISLSPQGNVVHEIQFSTGTVLKIECTDFTSSEAAENGNLG